MAHKNDVPGRDVDTYKRWGVAPSVSIGMAGPTKLTLQYLHQEDDNIPQYGVPYYDGLIPGVHRSDYFGYRNVDRQERSEEHTSELQSLMRNSYAVFCLKKKKHNLTSTDTNHASCRHRQYKNRTRPH